MQESPHWQDSESAQWLEWINGSSVRNTPSSVLSMAVAVAVAVVAAAGIDAWILGTLNLQLSLCIFHFALSNPQIANGLIAMA